MFGFKRPLTCLDAVEYLRYRRSGGTEEPLAFPVSTIMHWGYGTSSAAVWINGYLVLPEAGLYKHIWEYDAKALAWDLAGYLGYGAGTGTAFWLLAKILG